MIPRKPIHPAIVLCLILLLGLLPCCASPERALKPDLSEPQMVVTPQSVSLGIATFMGQQVLFSGCNFTPGDSVVIMILGVEQDGETADIPIAEADIDSQGNFTTELSKLSKITDFLRADTELDENMEPVLIVARPTIQAGAYDIRAESMKSDKKAGSRITLEDPSWVDTLKDWIGRVFLKKIKKA